MRAWVRGYSNRPLLLLVHISKKTMEYPLKLLTSATFWFLVITTERRYIWWGETVAAVVDARDAKGRECRKSGGQGAVRHESHKRWWHTAWLPDEEVGTKHVASALLRGRSAPAWLLRAGRQSSPRAASAVDRLCGYTNAQGQEAVCLQGKSLAYACLLFCRHVLTLLLRVI